MKLFKNLKSWFKQSSEVHRATVDADFSEYAPIDTDSYTNEELEKLTWLAQNVSEWSGGNYNFIAALKCDNSDIYENKYTPIYSKRPRSSERFFSKDELFSMKEYLGV